MYPGEHCRSRPALSGIIALVSVRCPPADSPVTTMRIDVDVVGLGLSQRGNAARKGRPRRPPARGRRARAGIRRSRRSSPSRATVRETSARLTRARGQGPSAVEIHDRRLRSRGAAPVIHVELRFVVGRGEVHDIRSNLVPIPDRRGPLRGGLGRSHGRSAEPRSESDDAEHDEQRCGFAHRASIQRPEAFRTLNFCAPRA